MKMEQVHIIFSISGLFLEAMPKSKSKSSSYIIRALNIPPTINTEGSRVKLIKLQNQNMDLSHFYMHEHISKMKMFRVDYI